MVGRRLIYLASLAGAVAFYIFYREWMSWLILVAVLCLPWFSLAVSLPALLTFRAGPDCPATVPMGESARAYLRGSCPLPQPLLRSKLRVRRTMTGERWNLGKDGSLPTEHCGKLVVEPLKCRTYDYLGLFRFRVRRVQPGITIVRPHPVALETPPDLSRYLARAWRPKRGGGFGENHELRLYRPGDSLQQIHWKLTAKTGKLILRETVEQEDGLVLLKLDLKGTPEELDGKLGKLLWLSEYLLNLGVHHEIRALTGGGIHAWPVRESGDTLAAVDALLGIPRATAGSILDARYPATWEYYIGGGPDET